MSATLDFLSRIFAPVRRVRDDAARHRAERDSARTERDRLRAECDAMREKLALRDGARPLTYQADGLATIHDTHFLEEPEFLAAYAAGVAAAGEDYDWRWRVHTGLWAARHAAALRGDFVECGVHRGFLSAAIMHLLGWENEARTFWLLDTFQGLVDKQIADTERKLGRRAGAEGSYEECYEAVVRVFSKYPNVRIVRGAIPDTLAQAAPDQVAYLHVDMNCAAPEIAAAEWFWPRLVPGGVVLLDDYAYAGFTPQREAWNAWAKIRSVAILSLPTGQGLLLKP